MLTRRPASAALLLAIGLLAGACISSDPPPADVDPVVRPPVTTAPAVPLEPVDEATVALVEDYWEARDTAWAAGVEAGLAFTVANNHPLLDYTADECRETFFGGEAPLGFAERNALAPGTVMSDPDFMMSVGPLAGRDLGEGVLEMTVAFSYEGAGLQVADRVTTVHLQVIDDQVHHFLVCDPVEVQVVQAPADTGGTSGDGTTGGTGTGTTVDPVTGDPITVLPPITATPVPVDGGGGGGDGDGDGDGDGGDAAPAPPPPPGTRPPGSGIDFCERGDPGAQPVAGDYFLCPDDDVDPYATEDPEPGATASEDITRG